MKLRKCIILLPIAYNDGTEVPPAVLLGLLKEIDEAFDGHHVAGVGDGAYKMADGTIVSDKTLDVWVVVDDRRVDELREFAAKCAAILKQESVYFEVTAAEVEFVPPSRETGEAS
jgi:hypothetical protein